MALTKAALKKRLHAMGVKTYRNKKTMASFVKRSDVVKILAKIVEAGDLIDLSEKIREKQKKDRYSKNSDKREKQKKDHYSKNPDKMLDQYLETALWSSSDFSDEPLDKNYSIDDISDETKKQAKKDLEEFEKKAGDLLDDLDETDVAHNFWLTRNGHGAGFWDGDYEKDVGDKLTKISDSFTELSPIVGDDGSIYFE